MSDNKIAVDTVGLTWSVQPRKKGNAQIRLWVGKIPIAISTGHKNPGALSKSAQARLISDHFRKHPVEVTQDTSFASEISRFVTLKYEGRKPKTIREVIDGLERLQTVLGVSKVEDVTKRLCETRKDALRGTMAPATWKGFLARAAKFLRWEISEGNLKFDPLVNFQRPAKKEMGRREDIWEPERYEGALSRLSGEDREMLVIFRETAIDPSDLFHLNPKKHIVKAVGPNGPFWKILKVRQKAKSSSEKIDQPLSKKAAEVILPRLENWFDFSRYTDSHSFGCAIRKKLHRAQKEAGFSPTFGIKALRHTFATYHANRYLEGKAGPPMEVLRQWLGHAPSSRVLEGVYMHTESSGMYQE